MKLMYFGIPALGEPLRMLLEMGGFKWEDQRVNFKDWNGGLKATTKYGQMPVLTLDDNKGVIAQSKTIARFLAKQVKVDGKPLYPEDPVEAAKVDELLDFYSDIHGKIVKTFSIKDQKEKEAARQSLLSPGGEMASMMAIVEKNCEGDYVIGNSMTLADIWVAWYFAFLASGFWDGLTGRTDMISKPYPKLSAVMTKVLSIEKLKAYYSKQVDAGQGMYKAFCN